MGPKRNHEQYWRLLQNFTKYEVNTKYQMVLKITILPTDIFWWAC